MDTASIPQVLRWTSRFGEACDLLGKMVSISSLHTHVLGHGIGKRFHENPNVLHYGRPGTLEKLVPGMIFTVEPMLNAGRREIRAMGDGWTIKTTDRSLSAQWEHTVLVTETGYEVLTISKGMPLPPAWIQPTPTPSPIAADCLQLRVVSIG